MLIFISELLSLLREDLLDDRGDSLVCKEILEQFFLFLRFKLAYINAVYVRYLDLISLNLDTLDVFELCECPPLSHILFHLVNVFYKYLIQLALLIHLLLIQRFNPTIDLFRLVDLNLELLFKLPLHIRLPDRVESKVLLDLSGKLFLGRPHLPDSLHEVGKFGVAGLQGLLLLGLELSGSRLLSFLLRLQLFSLVWIQ